MRKTNSTGSIQTAEGLPFWIHSLKTPYDCHDIEHCLKAAGLDPKKARPFDAYTDDGKAVRIWLNDDHPRASRPLRAEDFTTT